MSAGAWVVAAVVIYFVVVAALLRRWHLAMEARKAERIAFLEILRQEEERVLDRFASERAWRQ